MRGGMELRENLAKGGSCMDHICWWCQGRLVWSEDVDFYDGVCAVLNCPDCGATATFEPPER